MAVSEAEIFCEARDRMKISLDANSHNRKRAKEDMLFREGENHWDQRVITTASQETPELVINFTDTWVNRVVNNIADLDTRGKCHPVADGADSDQAEVINGLGRHVEARSDATVAYDGATDNACTMGWGWARVLGEFAAPDSFDMELRIAPIKDPLTVYEDPSAIMPTASDMRWCLISSKMKRTEFKRLYPKAELNAFADGDDDYRDDWDDKEEIRLAEYFRILDKTETLYKIQTAQGKIVSSFKSDMPDQASLDKLGAKIIDKRESSRHQVQRFTLNGTKVVDRAILPGEFIPVVRCEGNAKIIDGKVYRRGMVRTMQDPQRMVDYGETAKVKRLGLTSQAQWVAAEGQLDGHPEWDDANNSSYVTLTYKPVTVQTANGEQLLPPPQKQPPAQVEAGFSEFVQGMRSNLMAIAGMPNEPGQDANNAVSGRALQRRDKLSDQSHSQYYKNKKLFVAQIWKIMLQYFPHYYSEERMQRIIGGDGKPQLITLNEQVAGEDGALVKVKNDMSVGRFDVVMEAGPSYETMREEGAEHLMELMGSPPIAEVVMKKGPDLLFRSMDFQYAEEMADRLVADTPDGLKKIMEGLPKEAKAIVQSLSSELKNTQQALQQAQQDLKLGLTKAHLAATVKAHDVEESNKTKRMDTESRERTQIQTTAMKGHVELAKEEVAAGASLLNTHVEAKYHEREADRLIKTAESAEETT